MSARELLSKDGAGATGWDYILGDPAANKDPLDKLMVESPAARDGVTPSTGDTLAPADSSSPTANPINGHEWAPKDDLQFACAFKLPVPQTGACSADDIAANRLRFVPDANENGAPYATIGFQVSDGSAFSAASTSSSVTS